MIDFRLHGRGGQGAVTAGNILAKAAFAAGNQVRAQPVYGGERRGAPVVSYLRIDQKPIRVKSQLNQADTVVVFDSRLVKVINIFAGIKNNSTLILNTRRSIAEIELDNEFDNESVSKIILVNANEIAEDVLGATITSTVMLGAIVKAYESLIPMEFVREAVIKSFSSVKQGELNVRAMECGYNAAKVKEVERGNKL